MTEYLQDSTGSGNKMHLGMYMIYNKAKQMQAF